SRVLGARLADGTSIPAADVVVAAGPWSPALADPSRRWRPIRPLWGVVVTVDLATPPRHVAEEAVSSVGAAHDPPGTDDPSSGVMFSLVTASRASSLGSAFLEHEPDPAALGDAIVVRGARFVPAVASAPRTGVRVCARPLSLDGRPLLGRIGWSDGLWIAAGHGPWGISTGPGSATLVADLILGRASGPPPELDPSRFGDPW
ncbi:MAG: FAD-binding oxidoreductase, partial [Candidatus Limnocylindrales bacterium]